MKFKVLIALTVLWVFSLGEDLKAQADYAETDSLQSQKYRDADLEADYTSFKHTDIKIRPPKHFEPFESKDASGLLNSGTGTSIVAFEYKDTPYVGYYDVLAPKAFRQVKDAVYKGEEDVKTLSGHPAKFFYYNFFTDKGMEVNRIIFFTGDTKQMVFLQANYPAMFDPFLKQVLIQSFLTVKFK